MEIRIYAVALIGELNPTLLNDDEFIAESERQGLVWSLNGFVDAFNAGIVDESSWFIRVIKI